MILTISYSSWPSPPPTMENHFLFLYIFRLFLYTDTNIYFYFSYIPPYKRRILYILSPILFIHLTIYPGAILISFHKDFFSFLQMCSFPLFKCTIVYLNSLLLLDLSFISLIRKAWNPYYGLKAVHDMSLPYFSDFMHFPPYPLNSKHISILFISWVF